MKVVLITNIITPYRIPLLNYLHKKNNFAFKAFIIARNEENRKWRISIDKIIFNYQILSGVHFYIRRKEISIHLNTGVFKKLWKYDPDIIITSGYDSLAYWQALLYCKIFKKKFVLWNGTTLLSVGSIRGIKGLLKRIIFRGADRYIAYGTKAKEYLEYLGAKSKKIYIINECSQM